MSTETGPAGAGTETTGARTGGAQDRDTELVWLWPDGGRAGDGPPGARLARLPLDADGLGDLLDGFGFDESHGGLGVAPLHGPPPAPPLGALQRETRARVSFERATPGIEIVAFVHRAAGLTREEFQVRYRALGLRLRELGGPVDTLCRYAQRHVVGDADGPDALGELGFVDADHLRRFLTDPWLTASLLPYEAEFIDHRRSTQLLVRRASEPA
ncbi:hypothetical protein AB0L40_12325 [Patulibacter sp. NPDC049589]|uniref:hypothetical protein n=1 Tax=Patulibacter sp. NPDC049589 TaxID=3154731 RepID=UPI003425C420